MAFLARLPRVPTPAILLIAAAVLATFAPALGGLSVGTDQHVVTVALIVILFDGGMHIGWPRMRPNAGAVLWLGVAGTLVTAGALAVAAHLLFGFDWRTGLLLGAALAPTDPAVVFSVLGKREITGRSGTLLEGESGANDPVGIALMISLLGAGGSSGWDALRHGLGLFALQLGVGAVFGLAGGWLMHQLAGRAWLPRLVRSMLLFAIAFGIYAAAAALEGSGFLAVFLAGILVGGARAPGETETTSFSSLLSSVAEVVAFAVLGLSIDLESVFTGTRVWVALGLAALLIVIVRPLLVGAVLVPVRMPRGERTFVLLAGLKGAVPMLLGTYVIVDGVRRASEIYDIVFVVVLVSVLVQGGLVPTMARLLHVPMRTGPENQ